MKDARAIWKHLKALHFKCNRLNNFFADQGPKTIWNVPDADYMQYIYLIKITLSLCMTQALTKLRVLDPLLSVLYEWFTHVCKNRSVKLLADNVKLYKYKRETSFWIVLYCS